MSALCSTTPRTIWGPLRHYPYIGSDYSPNEAAARVPRLERFADLTCLLPCKWTTKHQKIADAGNWGSDHATSWRTPFGAPVVMSEGYRAPDLSQLALTGTAFRVVPREYSIYRTDIYMVLLTPPRHAAALDSAIQGLSR